MHAGITDPEHLPGPLQLFATGQQIMLLSRQKSTGQERVCISCKRPCTQTTGTGTAARRKSRKGVHTIAHGCQQRAVQKRHKGGQAATPVLLEKKVAGTAPHLLAQTSRREKNCGKALQF